LKINYKTSLGLREYETFWVLSQHSKRNNYNQLVFIMILNLSHVVANIIVTRDLYDRQFQDP